MNDAAVCPAASSLLLSSPEVFSIVWLETVTIRATEARRPMARTSLVESHRNIELSGKSRWKSQVFKNIEVKLDWNVLVKSLCI